MRLRTRPPLLTYLLPDPITGCGPRGALLLGSGVCVCAVWRFVMVWVACGGRARCGCRVFVCVRACGVWFVGCVIPWLVLVVGRHGRGQKAEEKQKKRSCRCVAEMRDMRNVKYIPLYLSHHAFFPLWREGVCRPFGGLVGCGAGAAVLPLLLWFLCFFFVFDLVACCALCRFFFSVASSKTYLFALCFPYRESCKVFFFAVTYLPYLVQLLVVIPYRESVCVLCGWRAGVVRGVVAVCVCVRACGV